MDATRIDLRFIGEAIAPRLDQQPASMDSTPRYSPATKRRGSVDFHVVDCQHLRWVGNRLKLERKCMRSLSEVPPVVQQLSGALELLDAGIPRLCLVVHLHGIRCRSTWSCGSVDRDGVAYSIERAMLAGRMMIKAWQVLSDPAGRSGWETLGTLRVRTLNVIWAEAPAVEVPLREYISSSA